MPRVNRGVVAPPEPPLEAEVTMRPEVAGFQAPTPRPLVPPTQHPKIHYVAEKPLYIKALIYGEPGAGKTFLAATAPDPLILVLEPGVSDATLKYAEQVLHRRIATWDVHHEDDIEEAYDYLSSENHGFKTVVFDSGTDFQRRAARRIIEQGLARRPSRDPEVLEESDWGRLRNSTIKVLRAFRDLPMHVVVTALATDIKGDSRRVPYFQPRGLALEIPAFFSLVGYLGVRLDENGEPVRKLLVEQTDEYMGKNPGGALPPVIERPDLTEMFNLIGREDVNFGTFTAGL